MNEFELLQRQTNVNTAASQFRSTSGTVILINIRISRPTWWCAQRRAIRFAEIQISARLQPGNLIRFPAYWAPLQHLDVLCHEGREGCGR